MIFPSIKNFLTALWRFLHRPEFVPADVEDIRNRRCRLCVYNTDQQCTKCTCFIGLKVKFATEGCPEGYWREYFSSRRPGI